MSAEFESTELREWRKRKRAEDLSLVANAAVSDHPEPTQTQREHAAMARRILDLEAARESAVSPPQTTEKPTGTAAEDRRGAVDR